MYYVRTCILKVSFRLEVIDCICNYFLLNSKTLIYVTKGRFFNVTCLLYSKILGARGFNKGYTTYYYLFFRFHSKITFGKYLNLKLLFG